MFYIPMQAVQPSLPARGSKNCPFGLRQQSSMLAASNSPSAVPQFNSPEVEGVVKHLNCALPVGNISVWCGSPERIHTCAEHAVESRFAVIMHIKC